MKNIDKRNKQQLKKVILIILLFLYFFNLGVIAQEPENEIIIQTKNNNFVKVPKTTNGGFFEYLFDVIVGTKGLHAQEIVNRGFDLEDCWSVGLSCLWPPWNDSMELAKPIYRIHPGGVNRRGVYYQEVAKYGDGGSAGICQKLYISDDVSSDFYIYLKGDSTAGEVYLSFRDTLTKKIYYIDSLGIPSENWKKVKITIPPLPDAHLCLMVINFKGMGSIYLDEASLMPNNNVYGVRKEIYDIYKAWAPGIIRYPGGWMADMAQTRWEDGIGPLDERTSPKPMEWSSSQRMDFGTDEFVAFCKDIGAEPHMVLPFFYVEPEYAANWIEYCNGDTTTTYGKLRASYGNIEPYNVKYWEVGNEQWSFTKQMADRYNYFYEPLKNKDKNIRLIMCANLWGDYPFFDTCITTTGSKMEIYGWHWAEGFRQSKINNDITLFLNQMAAVFNLDISMSKIESWIRDRGYEGTVKQGITELLMYYDEGYYTDPYLFNLMTGLWTAMNFNVFTRHSSSCEVSEHTSHSGIINIGYNKQGRRIFAPTPSYYVHLMISKHSGDYLIPSIVKSEKYNTPYIDGVWPTYNVPYLDVAATATLDTLFLSVVNINPDKEISTTLNFNNIKFSNNVGMVYELNSNSLLDANTPDNVNNVVFQSKTWEISNKFTFPAHSYTIIAIPCSNFISSTFSVDTNEVINVKLYPNPVENILSVNILGDVQKSYHIQIFNELGRDLYNNSTLIDTQENSILINTNKFPIGNYIFKIDNGKNIKTARFIVLR